jgi:tartrate-resistant acid phosphatase type 5
MIDTVMLCGGGNVSDWDNTPLKGPKNNFIAEAYWQWIEEQLRQSTYVYNHIYILLLFLFVIFSAPYLLVNGHFPVYSVAEHGPTKCLVDRLRPLLHQYRATAYICGHDHNLQVSIFSSFSLYRYKILSLILKYLAEDLDGTHMDYFVVGAGNIVEDNHNHASDVPPGSLKYFWGGAVLLGGFGLIEVNNTQMTFSFIEHSEKTLHQTTLKPRV